MEIHTCTVCGTVEFRTVPRTEHRYVDTVIPPTCSEEGHTHRRCTVCGRECLSDHVPALGHDWSEWVTETPSTCAKQGWESHRCQRCGKTESRLLPQPPHHYGPAVVVPPTETSGGYTVRVCTECGQRQISNLRPALGRQGHVPELGLNRTQYGTRPLMESVWGDLTQIVLPKERPADPIAHE